MYVMGPGYWGIYPVVATHPSWNQYKMFTVLVDIPTKYILLWLRTRRGINIKCLPYLQISQPNEDMLTNIGEYWKNTKASAVKSGVTEIGLLLGLQLVSMGVDGGIVL